MVNLSRFAVVFLNAQNLFLKIADFTFKFAQIIRGLSHEFKAPLHSGLYHEIVHEMMGGLPNPGIRNQRSESSRARRSGPGRFCGARHSIR